MNEEPPEVPAATPAEPSADTPHPEPAAAAPAAAPVPPAPPLPPAQPVPPPFAPVVRTPWVNPSRRGHVAGVAVAIALAFCGAGIGIGLAIGGGSDSHPAVRIQRGPLPGFHLPGRGAGPDWHGPAQRSNGNGQPNPPSTAPSASPSA